MMRVSVVEWGEGTSEGTGEGEGEEGGEGEDEGVGDVRGGQKCCPAVLASCPSGVGVWLYSSPCG